MSIATEMFQNLNKPLLLNYCWVPVSWNQKGIVVLVKDPFDPELRDVVESTFEFCPIIYAVGNKEDIVACINSSFDQFEIEKAYFDASPCECPDDLTTVVDDVLICL